jgi:nucleotidyltransferase substrate binding protein (TIGR01987 family)
MREAFSRGLITEGSEWMDMIKSRNLSTHTYNQKVADEIIGKIRSSYAKRFEELHAKLLSLSK